MRLLPVRFSAGALLVMVAAVAQAQLVVTPSNQQGWTFNPSSGAGNVPPPAVFLAPGFETPPLGSGSLHLAVGQDGNDAAQARHPGYAGTPLASLTALSYSTYVEVDGSGGQAPYLILNIDNTGDGVGDDTLHFEPVYQTGAYSGDPVPNQGALVTDTWQTWNALVGGWWSFNAGTFGPPLVTLSTYMTANPTATIVNTSTGLGGVRIVTGFGSGAWNDFLGAADNFTIGVSGTNTTYDFEAAAATTVTVTEPTPDGWTFQVVDDDADTVTTGTIDIVTGPGTPPEGEGSLEFSLGTEGEDGVQARNNLYDGQFVRDLAQLTYSTYVQNPGSGGQAPYIILDVDYNNDGVRDDLLFFEPVYQDATFCPSNPQATVALNTWQTWNAADGCWYSVFGTAGTGPGVNVRPLSTILDVEPDARLSTNIAGGSLRIVTGFGDLAWDNFIGNADALIVSFLGNTTMYDFEPVPSITIGDVSMLEGNAGTTNFVFTLTLSEAVSQTVTVNYTTQDDTALAADNDYTPVIVAGTATFAPQTTSTTITIAVTGDTKLEPDETFFVNLTNPQFATIADSQATGTIQNDDVQPTISINDVALAEGNAGTTNFVFDVTLSNASSLPITVNFATAPDSATDGTDYAGTTGMLTFLPNDTLENITVVVTGDTIFEPDETFFVNLSGAVNATIADSQGLGTIQNDDAQPAITINDVSQNEGNAGTTNFVFTVTLSNPSSQTITVNFTTTPGTATELVDYADNTGMLTFVANDTSETITVAVTGETAFEPNETFFVDLSGAVNATIADNQGLGTIVNDDGPVADVSITKTGPATVGPGENITYTITVNNAGPQSASNVVVTDVLPPGASFVSAIPSQGSCSGTSTVTCNLGALASGASATISLVITPPAGTVSNTATVTNTPEIDPTPGNNASTASALAAGAGVPTLSEWGLLALIAALLGVAIVKLR